jgi:cell division GTPase FtsZ
MSKEIQEKIQILKTGYDSCACYYNEVIVDILDILQKLNEENEALRAEVRAIGKHIH